MSLQIFSIAGPEPGSNLLHLGCSSRLANLETVFTLLSGLSKQARQQGIQIANAEVKCTVNFPDVLRFTKALSGALQQAHLLRSAPACHCCKSCMHIAGFHSIAPSCASWA